MTISVPNLPKSGSQLSREVLSPSQISTMMDCAYRWHAKHILRIPEPLNSQQMLGRAIHTALAVNFQQKCNTKSDLPVPGVIAVFREEWSTLGRYAELHDDEDPVRLCKTGEVLVSKYMEEAAPQIDPVAVEMRVEGVIGGVSVAGYIDLLDVSGRIIELKTARSHPAEVSSMHRFQVATYAYLSDLARGIGRIDTLVKTKSPQLVQQEFAVTGKDIRAIQTIYPQARELLRRGVCLPNRQSVLCSRRQCAYWRHCEQKWGGEVPET